MYLSFYGLLQKPFDTTPDPNFLFLGPGHREALAQLVYGVQESKGFIVLTGEVGAGKTTLLHALLGRLNGNAAVAFLVNSALPFDGIVEYMLEDFGVGQRGHSPAQRLFALNRFLIERRRTGQQAVLILDEAQNLDPPTLEQVRLLSNFETPTQKLLQIVLAGQPELDAKLQLPQLRQLRQRIGLRCKIPALTPEESIAYIRNRMQVANAPNPALFTDRALARICEYAGGIPRVINLMCDHCLLIGYGDQKRKLDRNIVDQAIAYFEDGHRPERTARARSWFGALTPCEWAVLGLATVLNGGLALLSMRPDVLGNFMRLATSYLHDLFRFGRSLLAT